MARGSITQDQLAEALLSQQDTGRLLGEICVEQWGVDRLALADALSEQWDDMQHDVRPPHRVTRPASPRQRAAALVEADELHALLREAEAARSELVLKTDELERRLTVLKALVLGVSSALEDLET